MLWASCTAERPTAVHVAHGRQRSFPPSPNAWTHVDEHLRLQEGGRCSRMRPDRAEGDGAFRRRTSTMPHLYTLFFGGG
jgi:hypothetical protein